MSNKPKTNQPEIINEVQGRDLFQTPNYAVDLLVSFIPKNIHKIWECSAGEGKIINRLQKYGYYIFASDIRIVNGNQPINFLLEDTLMFNEPTAIITNPPFSLKYRFIDKAIKHDIPFAFLIPFDMCQKMAKLFSEYDCQGLVPTRRIDYITPSGKSGATGHSSYYHSFWLTRYFNLPQQLEFVEIDIADKKYNI